MSRFSVRVLFVGAWLVGLAILMPPWSRTLSTPWGGVREFTWGSPIFSRPEDYRRFPGSNPWEVAADLVICEILVVAGACLILLHLDRTPHGSTNLGGRMSGAPLKVRSQSHSMLVLGTGVTLGVVEFLGAVLWALAGAGIYGSPDRCQMIAVSFVPEDPGHLRRRLD